MKETDGTQAATPVGEDAPPRGGVAGEAGIRSPLDAAALVELASIPLVTSGLSHVDARD
jgi:hypothetical protein